MNEKRLAKVSNDKMVAGVAGGLAEYFNVDATLVRFIFVFLFLFGSGGFWLYLILALVMPQSDYVGTVNAFDPDDVIIHDDDLKG